MIEWLGKMDAAAGEKAGWIIAMLAAVSVGFQRVRKLFQRERKEALHHEAEIDILTLLRAELSRLREQNTRLEVIVNKLQSENIELKNRIADLERVCELNSDK